MADATSAQPAPSPAPAMPADPHAKDWLVVVTNIIPIALIYTMMKKGKDSFYAWHSHNAAGAIVVSIALQILYRVLWAVLPLSLSFVFSILNLVNLALGILMIYGAWQGWQGKMPKLPLITQIGQKVPLEKWFNKDANAAPAPTAAPASSPAPAAQPTAPAAPAAPTEPTPPTPPATPAA